MKWLWVKIVEFMSIPRTRLDHLEAQVHRLKQEIRKLREERNELTAALAREVETNMLLSDTLAAIRRVCTGEDQIDVPDDTAALQWTVDEIESDTGNTP